MGPPEGADMPGRYEAQSALYPAQGIQDPLMIIHGTRDPVVLFSDPLALADGAGRAAPEGAAALHLLTVGGALRVGPAEGAAALRAVAVVRPGGRTFLSPRSKEDEENEQTDANQADRTKTDVLHHSPFNGS